MSLFAALTAKPWARQSFEDLPTSGRLAIPTVKLGLCFFLAVATVLFSLTAIAFMMRMGSDDWRPMPEPSLLWFNTLLLVLSSAALHWSWTGARQDNPSQTRVGLAAAGVFALSFLIGQLVAWRQLNDLGYFLASNPANTFFYMLTALHGLHLLGGLVAWGRTVAKLRHGPVYTLRLSLELCTLYWHFLLLVWLVLFALLLSDNAGPGLLHGMHHMH